MIAVTTGMVLAAGLGTRMRPLTDTMPKPLVPVAGRTLLDRALDHLEAVGVERAVVNTHYLGEMIRRHLLTRQHPAITLSHESELLDTGGGIAKALPDLGEPFYAINSDAVWTDGATPALKRLAEAYDPGRHDAVLLLQERGRAVGYGGPGDFGVDAEARPRRRGAHAQVPFVFTGVQLLSKRLFIGEPVSVYSMNRLYDKAIAAGRVICVVHDSAWFDVGTMAGLAATEARLRERPLVR
ncbi:MAG TPA: nucleotidyltransferase family protein [Stellaceae bacterium]|nr:nucleotidyltransferase family protein [Stellaceae bacterium]